MKKFGLKIFCVGKNLGPKKNLEGKIFWLENLLVRINFARKNLWSEINLGQKKCLSTKILVKIFLIGKNFGQKKICVGKKILSEKKVV